MAGWIQKVSDSDSCDIAVINDPVSRARYEEFRGKARSAYLITTLRNSFFPILTSRMLASGRGEFGSVYFSPFTTSPP